MNDPVAVLLVLGFVEWIDSPDFGARDLVLEFVIEMGVGAFSSRRSCRGRRSSRVVARLGVTTNEASVPSEDHRTRDEADEDKARGSRHDLNNGACPLKVEERALEADCGLRGRLPPAATAIPTSRVASSPFALAADIHRRIIGSRAVSIRSERAAAHWQDCCPDNEKRSRGRA